MDKELAQEIYYIATAEAAEKNSISLGTMQRMKNATNDFARYIYPEGDIFVFNSARWKRHFIE